MQIDIRARRVEAELEKTTLQPAIYRVQATDEPATYYVVVNRTTYAFRSSLRAVDISIKLHQLYHLEYTRASCQTYLFFQTVLFGIKTKYDKISPALALLTQKFKNRLSEN